MNQVELFCKELHCDCMAVFAKQRIPNFFCCETPKETLILVTLNLQT